MEKDNNKINQQLIFTETDKVKSNIKNSIIKSYQGLINNKNFLAINDLEKWLYNILNSINNEIEKLAKYFLKLSEISKIHEVNEKNAHKIESNSELNVFTSKDIQEENKEITRNFQNEAYSYMNKDEEIENENVAKFLKYVAQISRISYNVSFKILRAMKEKFVKNSKKNIFFNDENINKEFSFWIKSLEKEKDIFKEYENILIQEKLFERNENNSELEYLKGLYNDLSKMYFHCRIAFPLVEIDFKQEEDFNSEKMIDFINRGKNRKVNFIILPSLISNGSYLQNGKYWVFTYYKNTFKFKDIMNEVLNDLLEKENNNINFIKKDLKIDIISKNKDKKKCVDVKSNIEIPEDIEYELIFYFLNKKENNYFKKKTKQKHFEIDKNFEILKWEFRLNKEILISSHNIINEK